MLLTCVLGMRIWTHLSCPMLSLLYMAGTAEEPGKNQEVLNRSESEPQSIKTKPTSSLLVRSRSDVGWDKKEAGR